MKLVINRLNWTRGKGCYKTAQELQFTNKFDILMFLAYKLGYTKKDFEKLMTIFTPLHLSVYSEKNLWPKELVHNNMNTRLCNQIININDSDKINNIKREILLKEKFQKLNIDIEFINE